MQVLGLILILVAIYTIYVGAGIIISSIGAMSGIIGLAILIKGKRDKYK